jgi:hypothetical protein
MTYVFLNRQIHTTIFGTTMYFQYTIVLTIIVIHVSSFYNSSSGGLVLRANAQVFTLGVTEEEQARCIDIYMY